MVEENSEIKHKIIAIARSSTDMSVVLNELGNLLATLRPIQNADEINLVCDASIVCANKIERTEMIAQFYFMKARAEMTKPSLYIYEMKNLTLGLGWFGHALKVEKERYEELDKKVNNHWNVIQAYINAGFGYLKKKPYVGPAAYCYQTAGELYSSFCLQLKLYHTGSSRPWRAKIAKQKITMFLGLDDFFLLDNIYRKKIKKIKQDSFKYFDLAVKYYKQEKSWKFLADCYLALAVEYRSFSSPLRSKLAIYKAETLIKRYNIQDLEDRLLSTKSMPLTGRDID